MSVSFLDKFSIGNKLCHVVSYVASGAEDNLTIGMSYVDHFAVGIVSCATSAYTMKKNEDSSGTASNGNLGVSGVASGDHFYIYCYGK